MTINVAVVTRGRPQQFDRCIASIRETADMKFNLWMLKQELGMDNRFVDRHPNGSVWTTYTVRENLGCGGGRQFLVDRALYDGHFFADDDVMFFLDDDLICEKRGWMSVMSRPIIEGSVDILGVEPMRITKEWYTAKAGLKPDYVSGGWCAMSARVFSNGVAFDPRFYPNYFEDADICLQAKEKKLVVSGVENLWFRHDFHLGNADHMEGNRKRFIEKWNGRHKFI